MADELLTSIRKPTNEVLELLDKTEGMHSVKFSADESRIVDGYLALEQIKLSKDHGDALPKILDDLGEFDSLMAIGDSIQRQEDIDAICTLVFLKRLTVGGPQVVDDVMPRLRTFARLEYLAVRDSPLTGRTLGELAALPDLGLLVLSEIKNWQSGAAENVARIKTLRRFCCHRIGVTDDDVAALVRLPGLTRLDLNETAVTEVGWRMIGQSPRLTHVQAAGPNVTSADIQALVASQSIEWLDLRLCPQLDDAAVESLAKMPKLRKVQLNDKNQASADAVRRLARASPKLLIQHPATDHSQRHGLGTFFE